MSYYELTQQQKERLAVLDVAIRLTLGNEEWVSYDVIELAEYIREGKVPLPPNVESSSV